METIVNFIEAYPLTTLVIGIGVVITLLILFYMAQDAVDYGGGGTRWIIIFPVALFAVILFCIMLSKYTFR